MKIIKKDTSVNKEVTLETSVSESGKHFLGNLNNGRGDFIIASIFENGEVSLSEAGIKALGLKKG